MALKVTIATAGEMRHLWKLNHDVYCEELSQHVTDPSGERIDRLHGNATYFIARIESDVVGMLSVTPPGAGAISTLKRMGWLPEVHEHLDSTTEVRLLAVAKTHRGRGIYDHLIFALMQFCAEQQIHRIIISAVVQQVKLYELMGFQAIAPPVSENRCTLQPMLLLRADFETSRYRQKTLARMERRAHL